MVARGCLLDLTLSELRFCQHEVPLGGGRTDLERCPSLFFTGDKVAGERFDKGKVQPLPHAPGNNLNRMLRRLQSLRRIPQLRVTLS